jgi:hypothetical protein
MFWVLLNQQSSMNHQILNAIESLIAQHEMKKRRCLLELVAWKAACLANPSSDSSMPQLQQLSRLARLVPPVWMERQQESHARLEWDWNHCSKRFSLS